MRLLIVEDEPPAAKRLSQLLLKMRPGTDICAALDSVEGTLRWLQEHPPPDLAFFDIQLGDGLSFDIFQQSAFIGPVIFTTAYDQYALKAFKQDSIDYLLKPIDEKELEQALHKFERRQQSPATLSPQVVQSLIQSLTQPEYQSRFIIKTGQQLSYIPAQQIRYFYSEDGIVFAQMEDRKRHALDYTLDALEPLLDPASFFRLSRKVIANIQSVQKVALLFNGRLLITLRPAADFEVTVSRDRASDFKRWLGA